MIQNPNYAIVNGLMNSGILRKKILEKKPIYHQKKEKKDNKSCV